MRFSVCQHEPLNKIYPYGVANGGIGFFTDHSILRTIISESEPDYCIAPFVIYINYLEDADYLRWCDEIIREHCQGLFELQPEKYIFFHAGDNEYWPEVCRQSIWFNASACGDNGVPLFQPIRLPTLNTSDIQDVPYDLSFQGTFVTHPIRKRIPSIMARCQKEGLHCCWQETSDFYRKVPEHWKLRNSYLRLMQNSKFVLCPRGWGHNSIRFFETIALGRIPVLISDRLRLPLEDMIEYNRFVVRVPEGDVRRTGEYIREFLGAHDLGESSLLAQHVHREYFADTQRFLGFHGILRKNF